MGLLQYTSNEMFSATELVRKNKNIFDKLNKKEIEKAVILRDGKPNIILLDFYEYEKIIGEYLNLKNEKKSKSENKLSDKQLEDEKMNKDKIKTSEVEIESTLSLDSKEIKDKAEALKEFWD